MFDSGYLSRGLALIESLRRVGEDGDIWVLCLDDEAHAYLTEIGLIRVHLLSIAELEQATPGLAKTRDGRSRGEFIFTCTPALTTHVRDTDVSAEWVIYLDADLWFFSSPQHVFNEMGRGTVGIVAHRFPDRMRVLEKYGTYNVAWVMFGSDDEARRCLVWWRDRCIEWCFDVPSEGRYADQGYLDQFAQLFPNTVVVDDPGVNVAPWNLGRHDITVAHGIPESDGHPIVFFHFHGLRRIGAWMYPNLFAYKTRLRPIVRDAIYAPYVEALHKIEQGRAEISNGHPMPVLTAAPANRDQLTLRSLGHRARRRAIQGFERITGSALRAE